MKKTLCIVAAASVCFAGCSVKADRTDCPCLLRLNLSGSDETVADYDWKVSGRREKGRVSTDGEQQAGGVELEVSRGEGVLSVYSGVHNCYQTSSSIVVPLGSEMDELYAFNISLDTRCDLLEIEQRLHRQYAFLYLTITGTSSGEYPYTISVSSNVCGVDISSLEPVDGPFKHFLTPVVGEIHRVCIPRQKDNSLSLEFYSKVESKASVAGSVESLPIGMIISESGYDWTSRDLQDIYLEVDYSKLEVSVNVMDWETFERDAEYEN